MGIVTSEIQNGGRKMKRVERMRRQKEQKRKRLTRALLSLSLLSTLTLGAVTVATADGQNKLEMEKKAAQAHVTPEWKARTLDEVKAEIKRQKELGLDVYVIQWGDTLGTIATATNQNVDELAKLNNLENKHLIITGSTLKGVLNKEVVAETPKLVAQYNEASTNNIQTVAPSNPTSQEKVDLSVSKDKFKTLVEIENSKLPQAEKEKLADEVNKAETKKEVKSETPKEEVKDETKPEDKVEASKEESKPEASTETSNSDENTNHDTGYYGSDSEGRILGAEGKPLNDSRHHNGYMNIEDYVPGQRRPELAGKTLIVSFDGVDGVIMSTSVTWDKDGYPLDGKAVRPTETTPTAPEVTPSGANNATSTQPTRMSEIGNGGEFATFEEAEAYAQSKYNDDEWIVNSEFTAYRVQPIMWTDGSTTYTVHFF